MKKLHFYYRMFSEFTSMISDHSFTLKCVPRSGEIQQIHITKQKISPVEWMSEGTDSFGYSYIYGSTQEFHDSFFVEVEGIAQVDRTKGFKGRETASMRKMYCFPTELTKCSGEMKRLATDMKSKYFNGQGECVSFRDTMFALMHEVFSSMEYCPGATHTHTTAQDAFCGRKGVCQDYAHILIGLCRELDIPAFYVAGYMMGEGASHAWVAAFDRNTQKWYEIDPTNDRWVDDDYICVSHGFDSSDCIMNKGIFRGTGFENQEITVIVEETE